MPATGMSTSSSDGLGLVATVAAAEALALTAGATTLAVTRALAVAPATAALVVVTLGAAGPTALTAVVVARGTVSTSVSPVVAPVSPVVAAVVAPVPAVVSPVVPVGTVVRAVVAAAVRAVVAAAVARLSERLSAAVVAAAVRRLSLRLSLRLSDGCRHARHGLRSRCRSGCPGLEAVVGPATAARTLPLTLLAGALRLVATGLGRHGRWAPHGRGRWCGSRRTTAQRRAARPAHPGGHRPCRPDDRPGGRPGPGARPVRTCSPARGRRCRRPGPRRWRERKWWGRRPGPPRRARNRPTGEP